jgi:acyl transferase domain-containing protein
MGNRLLFFLSGTSYSVGSRYVPSEGAVAFVLKTRRAAQRDKDRILATIKASEVSHNGRSQGLVAPNVKSQAALHRSVLEKARLDPALIK